MKKIFALLALVLGVVSCQTEPEGLDVNVGGEQEVMLTVSLPETTRANSANGFDLSTLATTDYSLRYILEVYLGENCQRHVLVSDNTSVAFPVRLAPDRNYQLVVWADIVKGDSQADRYYNTTNGLDEVTIIESNEIKWNAMNETRDAFTATKAVSAQDIATGAITMTLKRPFAKLRVVATDYKDVVELGLKPATATVVYSQDMPRIYNALTGIASDAALKSHTINYPATPVYVDATGEYTLFADYFFVPASGTAKFQFNVYAEGNNLIKATNFNTDIYVAANKLTTIKGDVLTTGANINIDIEGGMDAPSYEYKAIGNATAFYEALKNGGEYIVTSDLVIDQAYVPSAQRTATRTTGATAEGKVTTINLNGMTITVKNQGNDAFVTLDTNDALILAGEGTITGSGELVDGGNVVVTGDANVDVNVIPDVKLGIDALKYILANGGEFNFTENLQTSEVLFASATNPVVIDLGRNTFTFTSNRGFRINENANVVIKNGSIVNNADAGRCVETRAGGINLTLENVTLTATNGYYSQPFTVGGEGENITVNINNSTINAGNNGYGITTFNPVALNINASTITGYAALNIKPASKSLGSAGSVINVVNNSTLNGVNNVPTGASNSFSTIMIEDNNIEINVDGTSTVKATTSKGNGQCIVGFGNSGVTSIISDCKLTFAGEIVLEGEQTSYVGYSSYQGGLGNNTVKFAATYADELEAEGWIVSGPTDGLVTITSAVAKIGETKYTSLQEAFDEVQDETIVLCSNVTLNETVTLAEGKTAVLDLNGFAISHSDIENKYAFNNHGTLTIKDSKGDGSINSRGIYNGYVNGGENVATAKLTIENGTFNAKGTNGGAAVFNYGIADIKGGSFTSIGGYSLNNQSGASMTIANGVTANNGMYATGATVTINGGEISGNRSGCHVIYGWNANITINGGTLYNNNSGNSTVMAAGSTEITYNGGTYGIADGRSSLGWTSCMLDSQNSAKVIINDGTYNGGFRVQAGTSMTINGGSFNDCYGSNYNIYGTVTVKGGTYTDDTAKNFANKYIAEGYKLNDEGQVVETQMNNQIWYVSDEMALEPTNPDALDATVVSNVWDKTTGKGVITFDKDLTTIGEKAFQRVTNATPSNWATSISLPESVKTIGNYAFAQCYSLTTINIPDSVDSIGQYAFQSCDAVTTVTIGSGVTSIGSSAFYNCYEIKEIICESTTAPALADKYVFNGVDKTATVYVPAASVDRYKAAEFWSSFTNIVGK